MFLILFVVACLTQLPQDTEVPCDPEPTVLHKGSTAFCEGPYIDITIHLDASLEVNNVSYKDFGSTKGHTYIPFAYYDELYNTNVYRLSSYYGWDFDHSCRDVVVLNVNVYSPDGIYDFNLFVNSPNNQE